MNGPIEDRKRVNIGAALPSISGRFTNLFGGFFSPIMVGWLKSITGNFSLAFSVFAIFGLIGGLLILAVWLPERTTEIPATRTHAIAGE